MSLWKRNQLPKGTSYSEEKRNGDGLSFLVRGSPLSIHFDPNVGDSPKDLTNYLIALQVRRFGCSIELEHQTLVMNFKRLLKKHDPLLIKRGIAYAAQIANNPFSTKFVSECIEKIKEEL